MYETACDRLNAAGVRQYEISNFARKGHESRHNLKYWTRQPYLGFGVDAHSMLHCSGAAKRSSAVLLPRTRSKSTLPARHPEEYRFRTSGALEETFFLGLRLNRGVDLKKVAADFGERRSETFSETISECVDLGLLECEGDVIRLTPRGRLLSNEVFERFILSSCGADTPVRRL